MSNPSLSPTPITVASADTGIGGDLPDGRSRRNLLPEEPFGRREHFRASLIARRRSGLNVFSEHVQIMQCGHLIVKSASGDRPAYDLDEVDHLVGLTI